MKSSFSQGKCQGASIKTIMGAGDCAYTFTMFGPYTRCLPREVLVRILKQTSGSIRGVNVATMVADSLL